MADYRRIFVRGGLYFFTLVLEDRSKSYLTDHIDVFRAAYRQTLIRYPFETVAVCILPDHIHLLMRLPEGESDYPIRIAFLKTMFSRNLPKAIRQVNQSKAKRREAGIWQRRYWEHLIRDESDLTSHMDYIYYNPVKHGYVGSVREWPFSSFHWDVQAGLYPADWGGDIDDAVRNLYDD
ncbi:transposase [Eikenella sp. S3360]|uniref:Transposase n=1 Tax=Eikenella glucosivorans TaxID=2766967 RepID=A0ABS0NBY2_9NEIS|nr:transposase [Eikenella glucosivorans]MBH5329793.1 transposase [Eikenella glucosivorans]